MRGPTTAIVAIAASVLILSASVACGAEDHERTAETVALEWTTNEADSISEEIASEVNRQRGGAVRTLERVFHGPSSAGRAVTSYEGILRWGTDAREIRDTIEWKFGPPSRKEPDRYVVIATASVSFEIAPIESGGPIFKMPYVVSRPTMSYHGSVDYELEIDTAAGDVRSSRMLLKSVRIEQLPREGTSG